MDDDKIERQIAFIIEHQAKFDANMARLQERIDQVDEQVSQVTAAVSNVTIVVSNLSGIVSNLSGIVGSLTNIVESYANRLAALIAMSERHENRLERNDAQIAALIESGKETDKRLDSLAAIVEKTITDRGST